MAALPAIFKTLSGSLFSIVSSPTAGQALIINSAGTAWTLRSPAMLDVANTFAAGATFTGTVTATTFAGSAASLTNIPAGQLTGTIDPARIPVIASQVQVVSSGAIAALTSGQQSTIVQGAIVTTSDGRRWVYSGSGSKTAEASYIEMADVTPDWSVIANKPSFATVATSGLASDLGGTLADARLSSNVVLKNVANTFTAAQTINGDLTLSPPSSLGNNRTIRFGDGYNVPAIVFFDFGANGQYGEGIRADELQRYVPDSARHTWNGGGGFQASGTNEWMGISKTQLKVSVTNIDFLNLPTADPHVVGRLWRSTNDVKISTG